MEPLNLGVTHFLSVVIFLTFWLGLAYLSALIAQTKGYNFWLIFIVSLFVWWVTLPTFVVLLIAPGEATLHIPRVTAIQRLGTHRVCQVCGKANTINATNCNKCGMALSFSNSSKTAVETMLLTDDVREEVNEGRIRVCQRCGRLNSPKRRVCKSCGAEFAV